MKNPIISKSVHVLIVGLLMALAVFQNQWAALAVASVWLLFSIIYLLYKKRRSMSCWFKSHLSPQPQSDESAETPKTGLIDVPDVSDPPSLVALRHLNCRISDKLKSAYPDVTWNWEVEHPEGLATKGGTGRIKLHQAGEFTHSEVTVDQLARINFKMMKLVDINTLVLEAQPANATLKAEPITTDAAAWFDLVGRDQLTAIVTELNTRNHRKLSIVENGDVYVVEDDASVKQTTMENLPGKNYWNELSALICEIGIKAQVTGDQLRLAWDEF